MGSQGRLIAGREWVIKSACGQATGESAYGRGDVAVDERTSAWTGRVRSTVAAHLPFLPFTLLAVWALATLARVFLLRLGYPLDLEWMEGGTLVHALRLRQGLPLYAEPSVDFVPFLYTPLYPAVLSLLSKVFGLSYLLGRAVSGLAFFGALLFLLAAVHDVARQREPKGPPAAAIAAGLLGAAAVCGAYPLCGSFFDLVRCDSLWLLFVSAGLYCGAPGRSSARIVGGGLLLALAFFTKQTAAPFMVAAAVAVALTSGLRRGLLFTATAFGATGAALLVGQHLTHGWLLTYVYRLHQSHATDLHKVWPETPLVLLDYGIVLLVPIAASLALVAIRRRLSRALFYWAAMAATGLATAAVASATQGAFDNAYIPAAYFGALLAAACVVELPALAAPLGTGRALTLVGLGLLSAHVLYRWPDLASLVPNQDDHAKARRLLAYLVTQGPGVFVPCHPFYNVLAGGPGHLHVMGVNDVYVWPRAITGDPGRDAAIKERFRNGMTEAFRSRRWRLVIQDDCATPRLFGLNTYYRLTEDLARSGRAPRSLTGYRCTPRGVWRPQ